MLHDGPIPYAVHGVADYLVGALLIAAPFLFDFSDLGAATAVSIGFGVAILVLAATTDGPTSLVDAVPIPLHIAADVLVGAWFIASPFALGYSNDGAPTALFLSLGVFELLAVIATRFPREERGSA